MFEDETMKDKVISYFKLLEKERFINYNDDAEGHCKGKAESALMVYEHKFGKADNKLKNIVYSLNADVLNLLMDKILASTSVEEIALFLKNC